jgi:hypothetical protein
MPRGVLPCSMMSALRICAVYLGESNDRKRITSDSHRDRTFRDCGDRIDGVR